MGRGEGEGAAGGGAPAVPLGARGNDRGHGRAHGRGQPLEAGRQTILNNIQNRYKIRPWSLDLSFHGLDRESQS